MASSPSTETLAILKHMYLGYHVWVNREHQPQTWEPHIRKLIRKRYALMKRNPGSAKGHRYLSPGNSYLVITDKGRHTVERWVPNITFDEKA